MDLGDKLFGGHHQLVAKSDQLISVTWIQFCFIRTAQLLDSISTTVNCYVLQVCVVYDLLRPLLPIFFAAYLFVFPKIFTKIFPVCCNNIIYIFGYMTVINLRLVFTCNLFQTFLFV